MKNSKFIQSTIVLIIGGLITKILGMVIKIVTTRLIGTEGIGLYMLITPTFTLLIALAQLGFPVAISKLVAEDKSNNKNLVFSIIPISLMINLVIILLLLIFSPIIANNLLHESRTYLAIIGMAFVLPFISSIIRGYFFGKERMIPHVVSNICEDVIRIIIIIIGIPIFIKKGLDYAIFFLVISNIVSEITSILILFFFLPKNFSLNKQDFKPIKSDIKNIFSISIPTTGSRLIGNIGYFFEPIILTSTLLYVGYNNSFIVNEYGIISGYVIPLLLLPSFFTMAISQALIPVISKSYSNNHFNYAKSKIKQAIIFSLIIGVPITILFEVIPEVPLKLIYNTTEGVSYLRVLAPICLMQYIQSPLASALQAMGKAKIAMNATLIGIIIRTSLLFILSLFKIGMWGLVIATGINILAVTSYQAKKIKNCF